MRQKLPLFIACSLAIMGCSKTVTTPTEDKTPVVRYAVVEDFEAGIKKSYVLDTISLKTGKWIFNNSLVGNLAADIKNKAWSVRLKKGSLATNFEVNNLDTLLFSYAKYNNKNDVNPLLKVYYSTDAGVNYTQIGTEINVSENTFKVDTVVFKNISGKVHIKIDNGTDGRLNIDDVTFRGRGTSGIIFSDMNDNASDTTTNNGSSVPEPPRNVTAGTDAQPTQGDNSNLLMGNPTNAQVATVNKNNFLIDQKYYTESYDADRGTPNWVSWHLQADDSNGAAERQNNFAAWAGLPTGWYAVNQSSYSGSGYDRGHNCPSADRTSSVNANSATFLMTNMIPQSAQNNQKTWNNLEMFIRDKVRNNNGEAEAYIVMGSYGNLKTLDNGHVTVPSNVWKVVVFLAKGDGDLSRVNASTEILVVNTPNDNAVNEDWKKYIISLADLEKATGYNLLSALPAGVKTVLKDKKFQN